MNESNARIAARLLTEGKVSYSEFAELLGGNPLELPAPVRAARGKPKRKAQAKAKAAAAAAPAPKEAAKKAVRRAKAGEADSRAIDRILDSVQTLGAVGVEELAEFAKLPSPLVSSAVKRLAAEGKLTKTGKARGTKYSLPPVREAAE